MNKKQFVNINNTLLQLFKYIISIRYFKNKNYLEVARLKLSYN